MTFSSLCSLSSCWHSLQVFLLFCPPIFLCPDFNLQPFLHKQIILGWKQVEQLFQCLQDSFVPDELTRAGWGVRVEVRTPHCPWLPCYPHGLTQTRRWLFAQGPGVRRWDSSGWLYTLSEPAVCKAGCKHLHLLILQAAKEEDVAATVKLQMGAGPILSC